MSIDFIKERIGSYQCKTAFEEELALKEISQEIILMALSRQNFFANAEFHGGTALRIFYGLPRFSEDLDFALLNPDVSFSFTPILKNLLEELRAFGYDYEIKDRSETDRTVEKILLLQRVNLPKKIMIKLEVDSNPPLGAETEIKYLDFPFPFGVKAKNLPSSFAGKLHALLCRNYVKGRDWYDFIWYVSHKVNINFLLLENALKKNGPWKNENLSVNIDWLVNSMSSKINQIDWKKATQDVAPFIRQSEQPSLEVWGKDFFLAELSKMEQGLRK